MQSFGPTLKIDPHFYCLWDNSNHFGGSFNKKRHGRVLTCFLMKMMLSKLQNCEKHKQHVHKVHHSSKARETGIFLKTSLPLTRKMNAKIAVELYHIFSKILKL